MINKLLASALHDCFDDVTAVATPKQIRGLMKVEGLTNDEVKSHLQVGGGGGGGGPPPPLFPPNSPLFSFQIYCRFVSVHVLT
jgi:SHAQKYF class myb-like DNA-binding protein